MQTSLTVQVPATSANCGPGFDTFGVACTLYNTITISWSEPDEVSLTVTGEGAGLLKQGERNLAVKAVRRVLAEVGRERRGFTLVMDNKIPLSRGLGSSSAAIVGGMTSVNALLGNPLDRGKIFELANELEGHPDNVCPAIYGGMTVSFMDGKKPRCVKLEPPGELNMVVVVPDFTLSTNVARNALPNLVSHQDAVFNVSRAALFVAAICKEDLNLLRFSLHDKLHQQYRSKFIPGMDDVLAAADKAGALGGFISGSGPALMAFARAGADLDGIGEAMRGEFIKHGSDAVYHRLSFDLDGAKISARQ